MILKKICLKCKKFNSYSVIKKCRFISTDSKEVTFSHPRALNENKCVTSNKFDNVFSVEINCRRDEARRSVLISLHSKACPRTLYDYTKQFGAINKCYLDSRGKMLLEFSEETSVDLLKKKCSFNSVQNYVPVYSSFLSSELKGNLDIDPNLITVEHSKQPSDVVDILTRENTLADQIFALYDLEKATDLENRLRFMICDQLERTFIGIFPACRVLPFGSSVNGFGRQNGDLDMTMIANFDERKADDDVLHFQSLPPLSSRMIIQRSLDTLGGILHEFVPGCHRVQRILHARVPILKFHHQFTDMDCDLCLSNLSGFYMSELLNIFSQCDHRVQLLVFAVRKWAKMNLLTNDSPGKWITNFSLVLMVIFFLQTRKNPILPTIDQLKSLAGKEDQIVHDGINYTYIRKIDQIPKNYNVEDAGDLLKEFFTFYSCFDFKNKGISINSGKFIVKPQFSALFIQNPLDVSLNVSKNVAYEEIVRLCNCMQNSLWKLETYNEPNESNTWGLSKILENITTDKKKHRYQGLLEDIFSNTSKLDSYVNEVTENREDHQSFVRGSKYNDRIEPHHNSSDKIFDDR